MLTAVELFAGAGGLAMGVSLAGFKSRAVVEWDRWACDTIRENQERGFPLVADWPLHPVDIRKFDFSHLAGSLDLLAAGPPCQAFSLGGKHRAYDDDRDMFPDTAKILGELGPKAFIVENVKGLTRTAFANYFSYILLLLEFPTLGRIDDESWEDHLVRLQKLKTSGRTPELSYNVVWQVVNAADYGVPQRRERVFLVGFRRELNVKWSFPLATHSHDALLVDQFRTGAYWERHRVARRLRPAPPKSIEARLERLRRSNEPPLGAPWATVRDALLNVPDPRDDNGIFFNHRFQPGARSYPGHTGSPLDLPAKTLKAGVHGVPGGENMVVLGDGSLRYFTVRETARLQTFPDTYVLHGAWSEAMRQLGNAVPVALGRVIAASVAEKLVEAGERDLYGRCSDFQSAGSKKPRGQRRRSSTRT